MLGDVQLGTRTSEVLTCFAKTALGYNFNAEETKNMDRFEKSQFSPEMRTLLKLMVHTKAFRRQILRDRKEEVMAA